MKKKFLNNSNNSERAFGIKNRPGTPIKDIINNEYANRAEKEILKRYETFIKQKEQETKHKIKLTTSFQKLALKRREMSCKEIIEPYKMKMFKDIKARVKIPSTIRVTKQKEERANNEM